MKREFQILSRYVAIFCALWLISAPSDLSAIEVRIRARTQLTFDVALHRDGLRIEGWLRDTSGRPIPSASITIGAQGTAERSATTDDDGLFVLVIPDDEVQAQDGSLGLHAEYAGDSRYGGSQVERVVDVRKREVLLSISPTTDPLPLFGPSARFLVETYSSGAPVSGLVVVVEPHGLMRVQVTTGDEGSAVLEVPADHFPTAGEYPVSAVFEGTAAYNPTTAETKLTVVADSAVTLDVIGTDVDRVALGGKVIVGNSPKSDAIVVLETVDTMITRAVTDKDGNFQFELTDSVIPESLKLQSRLRVRARYLPGEPWISAASSPEAAFPLPGNSPIPLGPLLWPVAGLFAIGGGYRAFRSALPFRVLAWFRSLPERLFRRRSTSEAHHASPATFSKEIRKTTALTGVVIDTLVDAPVRGATVLIYGDLNPGGEAMARATTAMDGRFWFEPETEYRGVLRVLADGYLTATTSLDAQVAGRSLEIRIRAVPVRAELLDIYQRFVDEYWTEAKPWGHLTPRETQTELLSRIRRDHALVREFVSLFEFGYFSGGIPTPDIAFRLRSLVHQIRERNPDGGR